MWGTVRLNYRTWGTSHPDLEIFMEFLMAHETPPSSAKSGRKDGATDSQFLGKVKGGPAPHPTLASRNPEYEIQNPFLLRPRRCTRTLIE